MTVNEKIDNILSEIVSTLKNGATTKELLEYTFLYYSDHNDGLRADCEVSICKRFYLSNDTCPIKTFRGSRSEVLSLLKKYVDEI